MSEEVSKSLKPEIDDKSELEGDCISATMAKNLSDGCFCHKKQPMPDFQSVFSFENLVKATRKCMNGVRWKSTVQNVDFRTLEISSYLYERLHNGKFKFGKTRLFILNSPRGKKRILSSLDVKDRIVIRCFCDNFFVDTFSRRLIYDNGACLKGKGLNFSFKRIRRHLHLYFKRHQTNEGYVLRFDIHNFFGSIVKEKLIYMMKDKFKDDMLFRFFLQALFQENKKVGLNLGSQISQMAASYYLDNMDRRILKVTDLYGRYMDDGYVFISTKVQARHILNIIEEELKEVGLSLNYKKTQISKLSQQFNFLNKTLSISKCGKISIKPNKSVIFALIRKIRKMISNNVNKKQIIQVKISLNGYLKG